MSNPIWKVTPEDVANEIVSEHTFTAADGVSGGIVTGYKYPSPLDQLTFHVLILKNGTKVVGINHGSIDPTQHSAEAGAEKARQDAVDKVWELLGFRMRDLKHAEDQKNDLVASLGDDDGCGGACTI